MAAESEDVELGGAGVQGAGEQRMRAKAEAGPCGERQIRQGWVRTAWGFACVQVRVVGGP